MSDGRTGRADERGDCSAGATGRNVAELPPAGPLCLTGRIQVEVDGEIVADTDDVALCRCGHSRNKPFCDGSHRRVGFADPGVILGGRMVAGRDGPAEGDPVLIVCSKNGPLLVRGPLTVIASDGGRAQGTKGALCRCGASSTKPFCDGAHRDTGFVSERRPVPDAVPVESRSPPGTRQPSQEEPINRGNE